VAFGNLFAVLSTEPVREISPARVGGATAATGRMRGGPLVKSDPPTERNNWIGCYWKARTWLEVIKTGVWIVLQGIRPGGPFDLFS
jgi:hypothetical protein